MKNNSAKYFISLALFTITFERYNIFSEMEVYQPLLRNLLVDYREMRPLTAIVPKYKSYKSQNGENIDWTEIEVQELVYKQVNKRRSSTHLAIFVQKIAKIAKIIFLNCHNNNK